MPEDFTWGTIGKKRRDVARHFFKEAAFAASKNPSSILLGIHLNRALNYEPL